MSKVEKPKPTLEYVAIRAEYPACYVIGRYLRSTKRGVYFDQVCRIILNSGVACGLGGYRLSLPPGDLGDVIVTQADTFLGIVVKVERLIKLQPAEAPTT